MSKPVIPEANYTQIPNVVLEGIAQMGNAEMRIVFAVCRKTFGWHKEVDRISLTQLEALTGLSRQGVIDGTETAIESGWLKREENGNSFEYSLIVNQVDQPEMVKPVDSPSQASRPKMVKPVDTQKKEIKEDTKERKDSPAQKPKRERPKPPAELLISSIKHGDELQSELNRVFESKGRDAPLYFENILQKEAYQQCAESLNGKFMDAARNALGRGRESRRDLLASLQAWVKNERNPHPQYNTPQSKTPQPKSMSAVIDFMTEIGMVTNG